MKIKSAAFFSLGIFIFSLVFMLAFRTVPVSKLWKGYEIFYVYSNSLSESDILYVLEKNGCEGVISQGNQKYPVVSPVSPVQIQKENSYIYRRNGFFTDRTKSARVFYIPDGQSKNIEKSAFEISAFQGTVCGGDGKTAFPWISPIIALVFALVLLYFSQNRKFFAFAAFFSVLFAFCRPLYTVSAAAVFLMFSFFLLQKIWGRRRCRKTFFNSPYALVFASSPLLILIFSSLANAAFYLLAVLASFSSIYLYRFFEERQNARYSFKPVMIMSSKMIPIVGRNGIRLMGLMCAVILVLFSAFFFLGRVSNAGNDSSTPSLPSPVSKNDESLPSFSDFLDWSWNTITFPYRRLSENASSPKDGDTVSIPDYAENDGLITEYESKMYVYDSKFRDSVSRQVESLDYPSLEKMMMEQGKSSSYGYSKGKLSSSEKFGAVLLLSFALISFALSGYYIVGRKRYGLSI